MDIMDVYVFNLCFHELLYFFLNGVKCENDTCTLIINLILILVEIHKKGKDTHCWFKTNDTDRSSLF